MTKSSLIPSQQKTTIENVLKKENPKKYQRLVAIEKLLQQQRGYVFRMPPPNSPVIALMSGGLDTTVVISLLLKKYKLDVYPIYFERNIQNSLKSRKSVKYFSRYFSRLYPNLFHQPITINISIPPKEFADVLLKAENHIIKESGQKQGIPLQPNYYGLHAFYYALYLEETKMIHVRTIIGGWLPSNAIWFGYESLLSLRTITLGLCNQNNDNEWQYTSLPMEKELGFYYEKDLLIKIGSAHHLPLEKTWSCYLGHRHHCGGCPSCWTRKNSFKLANISDQTKYEKHDNLFQLMHHVKIKFKKHIKLLLSTLT